MIERLRSQASFYVITRNTDYMSRDPYPGVEPDRWLTLGEGHHVWYGSESRWNRAGFVGAAAIRPRWDVVYVNGMFSPRFSMLPVRMWNAGSLVADAALIAPRGMLAPEALRIKRHRKALFLRMARATGLYRRVSWHATRKEEADQLRRHFPGARTRVIPNLIDRTRLAVGRTIRKEAGSVRLISVARIAPEKNLLFALRVLKGAKTRVRLDVFGSVYDEGYMAQCRRACRELPDTVEAGFRGPLPHERLSEALGQYHAMILPTLGENFGHIVGESVMAGLPVIVSDRTPWGDLATQRAGYILSLENPESWIAVIDELGHMDDEAYRRLWHRTLAYATSLTDDTEVVAAYLRMFRELSSSPAE
jgi:glycosyltransferase involved in cell wall biosynthesis